MSKDYFGDIEVDVPPIKKAPRFKDYTGERYSKWQVMEKISSDKYRCKCDCGHEAIKPISALKGLGSMQCKRCYLNSVDYFMKKKGSFLFLVAMLLSSWLQAKDGIFESDYRYSVHMRYYSNLNTGVRKSSVLIDGKILTCVCGRNPIMIMIVYGHVQGFCLDHIPCIDTSIGKDCKCKE